MLSWFKWLVICEKAVNNISTDHIFSFKKQQFIIRFNFCDVQNNKRDKSGFCLSHLIILFC